MALIDDVIGGLENLWNNMVVKLRGKELAVLGARGVGKTHLLEFLTTGEIPESYEQTIREEATTWNRLQLQELDLKIDETRDLPGGPDAYRQWKELFFEADVIFYLFRIDKLMEDDAEAKARVQRDMEHIGGWLEDWQSEYDYHPPFFLIGTHGDLANPDLTALPPDKRGEYEDRIRELPVIQECVLRAGGGHKAEVVLGSLKSREETEALVVDIFRRLEGQL